jgi:hypothetical protein
MRISLIAAMAENRVIGREGSIPWKIPGEQKLFKRITFGHALIMGRKTHEDIGRPLPDRLNIVISRRPDYRPPGCLKADSLEDALSLCPLEETEVFIIGGGGLFRHSLPIASRVYLTVLPLTVPGDTFFPEIPVEFALTSSEQFAGPHPYTLDIYDRIRIGKKTDDDGKEFHMTHSTGSHGWNPDMAISLHDKLKEDLKLAMKTRHDALKSTVRQIMSEFFKLTVPVVLEDGKKSTRPKKAGEITNDDIIGIIQGLIKSEHIVLEARKETASDYLRILEAYLPRQASAEEITAWIRANIDFGQFKNKMQAMGMIMKHFGKTADGKLVNQILKDWV